MNQGNDVINLTIPARPEFISIARLASSGVASRMGCSVDDIEDIKMAVSEACSCTAACARRKHEVKTIQLSIECTSRSLIFTVNDNNGFENGEEESKVPAIPDLPDDEGRVELFLIHSLMDKVTFCNEPGVVVKMTKFLRRDGVEQNASKVSKGAAGSTEPHLSLSNES